MKSTNHSVELTVYLATQALEKQYASMMLIVDMVFLLIHIDEPKKRKGEGKTILIMFKQICGA